MAENGGLEPDPPIPFSKLRETSTSMLLASSGLAAGMASIRRGVDSRIDEEEQLAVLEVIADPAHFDELKIEAARRAELFKRRYEESPTDTLDGLSPRGAALRSVIDDATHGWI